MAVKENWNDGESLTATQINAHGTQINENDDTLDVVQVNLNEALVDIIQLQADAAITPATHSASVADIFSDATGYVNTIDTGNTTGIYLTTAYGGGLTTYLSHYVAGVGSTQAVITNGDFATGTTSGWTETKTGSATIAVNSNACDLDCGVGEQAKISQTINITAVSWIRFTLTNFAGPNNAQFKVGSNTSLDISANGTYTYYCGHLTGSQEFHFLVENIASGTVDNFLAYAPATDDLIQTESLVSSNATDITDTWLVVKDHDGSFLTGTYSASSDGGSTYTDSLAFNEKANITSTQGDELKIKINIGSTDVMESYSVAWWD